MNDDGVCVAYVCVYVFETREKSIIHAYIRAGMEKNKIKKIKHKN